MTECGGAPSRATGGAGSVGMRDAGVPLWRPVSGMAMGVIKEGGEFAVLSDSLGEEDHLGDMDFKVAGTEKGLTSLQMDIKITGITEEIMHKALEQAKGGREHILGEMAKALDSGREELSGNAPRIETMQINKEKIREVIGTGGKVIREIVEVTGAKVNIEDDGTVKMASSDPEAITAAVSWIEGIVAEPEVGRVYDGKVVNIVDFGAFVNFLGTRDGLVHISEIAPERIDKVSDVLEDGQMVKVKVLQVDDRGKVRLSMKVVDQETGEAIELPPREDGGDDDGDDDKPRRRRRRRD